MSATPKAQTFLAFDFGTRRIGVAVGQTVTGTATALTILPANDGIPDWQHVEKLINEWRPDAFVVGIPFNMDGSESEITARARKFGQRLHGRFGKACHEMDERLSSVAAAEVITEQEPKASRRQEPIDSIAAKLILESWLSR